jgi:hypothetical protein
MPPIAKAVHALSKRLRNTENTDKNLANPKPATKKGAAECGALRRHKTGFPFA